MGSDREPHKTVCAENGLVRFVVLRSCQDGQFTLAFSWMGAQWLSGRVLDLRLRGRRFEPHRGHCVVSLSKTH